MLAASNGRYRIPYHLEVLNDHLLEVSFGTVKRLIITMPPRHGKTLFTSIYFPVWWLCNNPDKKLILASYGSGLAYDPAKLAHDVFQEWAPQIFGLRLDPTRSAAMDWSIDEHLGGMYSVGRRGALTGKGASLFIIDDPIKDAQEAASEHIRDGIWEWYTQVASTRLEPNGAIILILTRWHQDDLAGRLLDAAQKGGEEWMILNMPAIAEKDEEFNLIDNTGTEITRKRVAGAALWPKRFSLDALKDIRTRIGEYAWAALYQQHPTPVEGGFFKESWVQFYHPDNTPLMDTVIQSWDTAATKSTSSDFVVGQVWARTGADFYLVDQVRDRMDFDETVEAMKELSKKWPETTSVIIEAQTLGAALAQHLKKIIPGIIPIHVKASKELRAMNVLPVWQSGNVYIPNVGYYSWVSDYVRELLNFPNATNDDQVDATTLALNQLKGSLFPDMKAASKPVKEKEPIKAHTYVLGWIPARLDGEYSLIVYDQKDNAVVRFYRAPATPIEAQITAIFRTSALFGGAVCRIIADYDDSLAYGAELKGVYVEKIKMNNAKFGAAVENLSQLIRNRLIDVPDYPELMAELDVFHSEPTFNESADYTSQIAQQSGIVALALVTYDLDPTMWDYQPSVYANFEFDVA